MQFQDWKAPKFMCGVLRSNWMLLICVAWSRRCDKRNMDVQSGLFPKEIEETLSRRVVSFEPFSGNTLNARLNLFNSGTVPEASLQFPAAAPLIRSVSIFRTLTDLC